MTTIYNFQSIEKDEDKTFTVYAAVENKLEVGFAIDFSSMGLSKPETNGAVKFVGDYE